MPSIAAKHSMDIPHVTSVELPLIVNNEEKAVSMLGGKEKISKVIGSQYKPAGNVGSIITHNRNSNINSGASASASSNIKGSSGNGGGNGKGFGGATNGRKKESNASKGGNKNAHKSSSSSSSNQSIATSNSTSSDNLLELRLRKDPFHHPVQSITNSTEKILVKVSIPKENIPKDYYTNPSSYSIRKLISINKEKEGVGYKIQPVAIIDNTHSFKSMADFQVTTRSNPTVQDFNSHVLNGKGNYQELNQFFESHENFQSISDYKDPGNYKNVDHQLPPPPLFSPIQFPFDYKYQKNPLTATMRDAESGEIKVVSKKLTPRLHTIIVDFNNTSGTQIPMEPAKPLQDNYKKLTSAGTKPSVNSLEFTLLECIEWLETMFEKKPIWTRKHLEDIVPPQLKRVIKQALPYVSFIYKSGPWRFCNVKFGVNAKEDKSYWKYQSEYFRIPGLRFNKNYSGNIEKISPPTLDQRDSEGNDTRIDDGPAIAVSSNLFFDGKSLPRTITYQVGDLLDVDIQNLLAKHQTEKGDAFYREKPDFQDGWINKQSIECIRRIIRYKLLRLVRDEQIDPEKLDKIIATDYTKSDEVDAGGDGEGVGEREGDDEEDAEAEGDADGDVGEGDDDEDEADEDDEDDDVDRMADFRENAVDEETLITRLKNADEKIANGLSGLVGFIKQESL